MNKAEAIERIDNLIKTHVQKLRDATKSFNDEMDQMEKDIAHFPEEEQLRIVMYALAESARQVAIFKAEMA